MIPSDPPGLNLPEGWLLPAIQAAINAPPPPKKKIYVVWHSELDYTGIVSFNATKAGAFKAMMRHKHDAWSYCRDSRWCDPYEYLYYDRWWIAEYILND